MGLGTMTVLHDANVEGSDPILNGVYAGGFESLVEATRQVGHESSPRHWRADFAVPDPFLFCVHGPQFRIAGPLSSFSTPSRASIELCKLYGSGSVLDLMLRWERFWHRKGVESI